MQHVQEGGGNTLFAVEVKLVGEAGRTSTGLFPEGTRVLVSSRLGILVAVKVTNLSRYSVRISVNIWNFRGASRLSTGGAWDDGLRKRPMMRQSDS